MKDICLYCENQDCICGDICCQSCDKVSSCNKKCQLVKYKEKIYNSDEFLIEELEKLAEREDNWLIAVASERIRSLIKE